MYITFDRKKVPSCTGCTILNKIKVVNIQQSQIFVFLLWYSHLAIYAWSIYLPTSLLLPNNVDVARFWDTQSSMQWYWFVHKHSIAWSGAKNIWYRGKHCETCGILCCKAGFFPEFYPYQNIFVWLFILVQDCINEKKTYGEDRLIHKKGTTLRHHQKAYLEWLNNKIEGYNMQIWN